MPASSSYCDPPPAVWDGSGAQLRALRQVCDPDKIRRRAAGRGSIEIKLADVRASRGTLPWRFTATAASPSSAGGGIFSPDGFHRASHWRIPALCAAVAGLRQHRRGLPDAPRAPEKLSGCPDAARQFTVPGDRDRCSRVQIIHRGFISGKGGLTIVTGSKRRYIFTMQRGCWL